ncbi:MICOS complex subunit MIC25 isoform X6 [Prionailurus viverrinus]|uniref:MICOS complex subunit MIC25 isoform X6 n=1 Tax=Prionailurus viverrinus TaxID=61388 RepID=UPI001FF47CA4|nr:MICOS complex subunit MIC25 isoform X6 [Prionailurus viverrinus]
MGSTESSEARRVSFGMDEEERVRVLQGIRLSENVVNRMKDPNQPCKAGEPAPPPAPPPSTPSTGGSSKGPEKDSKPPRSEYGGGRQPSGVEEDFLKRYKQEQAKVQDELFQVVTREREAATKHRSASMQRGEGSVDQDKRKSTQLARELESREAELSRRDTFYKEQLGRLERKEQLSCDPAKPAAFSVTALNSPLPDVPGGVSRSLFRETGAALGHRGRGEFCFT